MLFMESSKVVQFARVRSRRGGPPPFLSMEEAAAVLRIGRSTAYKLAREFESTDGRAGLPVVRCGTALRVPRARLEEMTGGPITWPIVRTARPRRPPPAS